MPGIIPLGIISALPRLNLGTSVVRRFFPRYLWGTSVHPTLVYLGWAYLRVSRFSYLGLRTSAMVSRFTLISTGLVGTEVALLTRLMKLAANSVSALLTRTSKNRLSPINSVYDVTRLMGPPGPLTDLTL